MDDLRHGLLCAATLAPHYPKGKSPDPCDFMVRRPPKRRMTSEEMKAALRAALGGTSKKKG